MKTEPFVTERRRPIVKTLEANLDPDFCRNWKQAERDAAVAKLNAPKGDLYFVRAANAVKIGRSVNMINRLRKMQADNHEEINCLLVLPGRGGDEALWHARFKRSHIRGEWFEWSLALHAAIEGAREERLSTLADERSAA